MKMTHQDVEAIRVAIYHSRLTHYQEPQQILFPRARTDERFGDYEIGEAGAIFGIPFLLVDLDGPGFEVIYSVDAGLRPERFDFDGKLLGTVARENAP